MSVHEVSRALLGRLLIMAEESVEIKLAEIPLGRRRIRFIDWTSFRNLNLVSKATETGVPLYLGADVLAECSIAVANLPRTHAKFAKKGFATKVYFPPTVKIVDVHGTGRGLWFYTIQGLFRIAFELYSRYEQLECMIRFSEVWKDGFSDPLLKAAMHIVPDKQKPETDVGIRLSKTRTSGEGPSAQVSQSVRRKSPKPATTVSQRKHIDGDIQQSLQFTTAENQSSQGNQASCPTSGMQFVEAFLSQYKERTYHGERKLDFLAKVMLEIVQEYQHKEESSPCEEEHQRVLLVISHWLGKEFHKYQDEIEEKVTLFKERHISSIDNLPPAQQVVEELFPACMRVLLSAWMGAGGDGGNRASQTRTCAEPYSLFPCIQLILELTNQIMVSGVAHVLYSRLNKTDCV